VYLWYTINESIKWNKEVSVKKKVELGGVHKMTSLDYFIEIFILINLFVSFFFFISAPIFFSYKPTISTISSPPSPFLFLILYLSCIFFFSSLFMFVYRNIYLFHSLQLLFSISITLFLLFFLSSKFD
jgi:hypothetical protein